MRFNPEKESQFEYQSFIVKTDHVGSVCIYVAFNSAAFGRIPRTAITAVTTEEEAICLTE